MRSAVVLTAAGGDEAFSFFEVGLSEDVESEGALIGSFEGLSLRERRTCLSALFVFELLALARFLSLLAISGFSASMTVL